MNPLKQTLKNILPSPMLDVARETFDAAARLPEWPAATLHPLRRSTVAGLKALKDTHRGERCFVIGNGPSLRQTDLTRLRGETTFGVNRIYLAFPEMGFPTSYYLCMNDLVIEQCAADIQALPMPKFVAWRSRRWLMNNPRSVGMNNPRSVGMNNPRSMGKPSDNLYFLYTSYTGPKFGGADITGRLWEGATVTNIALQVAFYLGFKQVILIGVDHNYTTQGKPNSTVVSPGADPNHFNPNYFGKDFRWQLPDLETSERGYGMARRAYEAAGRQVLDATVGGKLQVFPKVDYNSLF
jgi:hypothetical protein